MSRLLRLLKCFDQTGEGGGDLETFELLQLRTAENRFEDQGDDRGRSHNRERTKVGEALEELGERFGGGSLPTGFFVNDDEESLDVFAKIRVVDDEAHELSKAVVAVDRPHLELDLVVEDLERPAERKT
jgi:hypothetical protein